MSSQQKYLKYKSKYLDLKKLLGGTKAENNDFLLHGTNLYYIDDIKKYGLTGRYNDTIYAIIKKYTDMEEFLKFQENYVQIFISRQNNIRETDKIEVYFTRQREVANNFATGSKKFGEGLSTFLINLNTYITHLNTNKIDSESVKTDLNTIKKMLDPFRESGIILAIRKSHFSKLGDIGDIEDYEYKINFKIPSDKLYIETNDTIIGKIISLFY